MFGEWYQKTNKTEDTNKLTLLGFQNNHHPSQHTVGNVHNASGNCQQLCERCQQCVVKDGDYFESPIKLIYLYLLFCLFSGTIH
jgi:hypothetical protein